MRLRFRWPSKLRYGDIGYGLGFYRHGMWFGFGQIQFRKWGFDVCFLKKRIATERYNRFWLSTPHGETRSARVQRF